MKITKYSFASLAFSLCLFLFLSSSSFAQGVFQFEIESFDFGTVEEGNKAEKTFVFKNTGNQPIIMSNVRASCGCTTPSWTREPVLPGQSGEIQVSYNSAGRPGAFNKTITITSNASEATKVLKIRGNVVSDPANDPKMAIERNAIALGKIKKGEAVTYKISFTNEGKKPLQIHNLTSSCNCVKLAGRASANAGETKELEIVITPTQEGAFDSDIVIYTNSRSQGKTTIKLTGTVVEGSSSVLRNENSGF
ncbi:DUF1573 domain-containing protein [Bernardetia sp.]|uniref:DUF1573 domain-containing protein n=1 Tax=Bernardetia sp. TaxID=1937974 RepID=UPI0025BD208C|nr:DUF1573 domain-containing protein [Bernardetia sp.]